jgi:dsRNA-specific ribonuclease
VKPNQTQVEVYERGYKELMQEGYEFKNLELLLQSIVQRSTTEKLWNPGTKFNYSSSIEKDIIMQYNLQILEYLGDSILNFTVSKLFYCETADN